MATFTNNTNTYYYFDFQMTQTIQQLLYSFGSRPTLPENQKWPLY